MSNRLTEATVYGDEPTWEDISTWTNDQIDSNFARAIQWYNYMSDEKDHKRWLIEYCKENYKERVPKLSKLDDVAIRYGEMPGDIGFNPGIYARILSLGGRIPEKLKEYFIKSLDHLESKVVREPVDEQKPVVSIRDRSVAKSMDINLEIEKIADEVLTTSKKMDPQKIKMMLSSRSLKASQASILSPIWAERRDGFNAEDYWTYTKDNVSNYQKFLTLITDVLAEIATTKPVIVRKRRAKPATDQVKKMLYQKEDATTKTRSILPSKIIGGQKLVLFNTKYSKITILEAGNAVGFTVKGTTILGFDDTKSYSKKLKNPAKFLKELEGKGIRVVKAAIDGLKGKKYPAKGRTNGETIIFGVY